MKSSSEHTGSIENNPTNVDKEEKKRREVNKNTRR